MNTLPIPPKEAIIFEDEKLYVCLASFPITPGHCVVVWKNQVADLHLLSHGEYEYLMDIVEVSRNALLTALGLEKVYLMYMDELKQVHWHLIPRYDERGSNILLHTPTEIKDFSHAEGIKEAFRFSANIL